MGFLLFYTWTLILTAVILSIVDGEFVMFLRSMEFCVQESMNLKVSYVYLLRERVHTPIVTWEPTALITKKARSVLAIMIVDIADAIKTSVCVQKQQVRAKMIRYYFILFPCTIYPYNGP